MSLKLRKVAIRAIDRRTCSYQVSTEQKIEEKAIQYRWNLWQARPSIDVADSDCKTAP